MTSIFKRLAVLGLVLAVSASGGLALAGEPIPHVDIYLGKNPGGNPIMVGTTDREGRFSARVRLEPGEYTITTACAPRQVCPDNPLLTVSLNYTEIRVHYDEIRPDARGNYVFRVGAGTEPVTLAGRVETRDASATRR